MAYLNPLNLRGISTIEFRTAPDLKIGTLSIQLEIMQGSIQMRTLSNNFCNENLMLLLSSYGVMNGDRPGNWYCSAIRKRQVRYLPSLSLNWKIP